MAAKKKTARKKAAKKKATRKSSAKKKAAKKKPSSRKKSPGKKAGARRGSLEARTRKAIDKNLKDLERHVPKNFKGVIKDLRLSIRDLEKQFDKARSEGEKRLTSIEKQWRRDSERVLKRFGIGTAKKSAKRKKAPKRKAAAKRKSRR